MCPCFTPSSPLLFLLQGRCVYNQVMTSSSAPPASDGEDKQQEEDAGPLSLTHLLPMPASCRLATVTAEHNIQLYQLPALSSTQQQVGGARHR